jgi:hypothetical protein
MTIQTKRGSIGGEWRMDAVEVPIAGEIDSGLVGGGQGLEGGGFGLKERRGNSF